MSMTKKIPVGTEFKKTSVYTAFLLRGKVANLFLATSLYVKRFNAQNQHNILVVWVLLLTIRIYWSEWLYD